MSSPSRSPTESNEETIEGRDRADTVDSAELVRQIQAAASTRRPSSIAEALSLENDLNENDEHDNNNEDEVDEEEMTPIKTRIATHNGLREGPGETAASRRVSLDPHILARIVENLREDLARVTQDRDALHEAYEGAPLREKELRDALNALSEKNSAQEKELEQLRRKSQEDEEQIHMLRSKVDESRRGLMRLQAEQNKNKRQSVMSVDTGRANGLLSSLAGPSTSKRASFTPLTGSGVSNINGHRRISSISEPPYNNYHLDDDESFPPPSAARSVVTEFDISDSASTKQSRRASAFYAGMPLNAPVARSVSPSPPQQQRFLTPDFVVEHTEEFKALKKQREDAMEALAAAQQELQDAHEAREASEQCVVALRAFISEYSVGESGATPGGSLKLPPMPSENVKDDEESQQPKRPGVGGGFSFGKLFGPANKQPARTPSNSQESNIMSPPITSPNEPAMTPANASSDAPPANTNAFSRAFGGLFGSARKESISSVNSVSSAGTPPALSVTTPTSSAPHVSGETNSSAATVITQSSAPIEISETPDFLPPRLPNGLREHQVMEPLAADGQQVPVMNGMGSDSEAEHEPVGDGNESGSVDDPSEPESPEASFSKEDSGEVKVHDAASVGSAGEVLGVSETGKTEGVETDGVRLTFA